MTKHRENPHDRAAEIIAALMLFCVAVLILTAEFGREE